MPVATDGVVSDATSLNEAQVISETQKQSPKRSVKSESSQNASPVPGTWKNMSMMQTADEASALDNSFYQDVEFERRDFNEIDILGSLDRDEKGNVILETDA